MVGNLRVAITRSWDKKEEWELATTFSGWETSFFSKGTVVSNPTAFPTRTLIEVFEALQL